MEVLVFLVSAVIVLAGAVGVIVSRNPVHAALSLVATLFGIAVLFVAQEAHFLAAVQVIVYAGAIVVLFLFVIMLLGVDRSEELHETLPGQRILAAVSGAGILAAAVLTFVITRADTDGGVVTGLPGLTGDLTGGESNLRTLAEALFTDYLFAFEITSILLVIAVVAAVVLSRRSPTDDLVDLEPEDAP